MSDVVIRVENLSKHYRLGAIGGVTLREDVQRGWAKLRGKPDPLAPLNTNGKPSTSDIWALREVSFEVCRGEVMGIIGRNGAGKSTLLKILSRTTAPTLGRALVNGRIGSLLEVGTGFHPELSGRENIYLNGSILGMRKAEIDRRIDEIIGFSEVERFIDTPVKRYSSGMYVRLAFAVAAHLEPEVLIVDEVLAVGDTAFQRKCLGKMGEVSKAGRTVLFVSHNLAAVTALCSSAVVLRSGGLAFSGNVDDAVGNYLRDGTDRAVRCLADRSDRSGSGKLRFTDIRMFNKAGVPVEEAISGEYIKFEVRYRYREADRRSKLLLAVGIADELSNTVALFASDEMGFSPSRVPGDGILIVTIPRLLLRAGSYSIGLQASEGTTAPEDFCDQIGQALSLHVLPGDFWSSGYVNRGGNYSLIDAEMGLVEAPFS